MKHVFFDGIESVRFSDSVVRITFFNLEESENGAKTKVVPVEVALPVNGFTRGYATMDNLLKQMIEAGIVKRSNGSSAGGAAETAKPADPSASPNFQ